MLPSYPLLSSLLPPASPVSAADADLRRRRGAWMKKRLQAVADELNTPIEKLEPRYGPPRVDPEQRSELKRGEEVIEDKMRRVHAYAAAVAESKGSSTELDLADVQQSNTSFDAYDEADAALQQAKHQKQQTRTIGTATGSTVAPDSEA